MIFVGAQSIYTRAILANEKICMHDFLVGGTEILWGGGARDLPPPPVATPLYVLETSPNRENVNKIGSSDVQEKINDFSKMKSL